ncbi:hypothetical protein ACM1RC_12265 [Paenibacillus azoreducens]|uniref:hypothetical protein n=1 Tax=Paenibacillus azoreducens TaxID=116718 RepID=UPI0039F47604
MDLPIALNNKFASLISYTKEAQAKYGASASSVIVIQDNKIVTEWYEGRHHFKSGAIQATAPENYLEDQTQFNETLYESLKSI